MYGGKFAFQNRLGSLVVGRKFTIFALFYFVFEGKFQVQAPQGAYSLLSYGDNDPSKPHLNLRGKHFLLLFWVICPCL